MAVQSVARGIVWKLEHHCAHHGHAFTVRFEGGIPEIRHQATLQLREQAEHVASLFVVCPRNAIAPAAVQTAVRGEQPKAAQRL